MNQKAIQVTPPQGDEQNFSINFDIKSMNPEQADAMKNLAAVVNPQAYEQAFFVEQTHEQTLVALEQFFKDNSLQEAWDNQSEAAPQTRKPSF